MQFNAWVVATINTRKPSGNAVKIKLFSGVLITVFMTYLSPTDNIALIAYFQLNLYYFSLFFGQKNDVDFSGIGYNFVLL